MTSDGSDPPGLQALCDQGLALHRAGRLGEAAQRYGQVLSGDPEHFDALRLLGMLQAQSGRPDEGVALIKRAIRVKPEVATAHVSLGAALSGLNRPAEAVGSLDAAIALKPDYFEARFHRASALRTLDRRAEALADLDAAVALNPGSPEAYDLRAIVLQEMGRPEAALESYDAAVALRPAYAEGWNNRGALLNDLGRPEAALASLDRALAEKPAFAEAHYNRGVALDRLKRPEDALAAYDAAIALAPGHALAHNNRGTALDALGRPEDALASYDRAIALKPDYPEALANRGKVLRDLERPGEALASYDAAIALDPSNVDAHLGKGFGLLLTGQFEAGWREYGWRKANWVAAQRLDPERAWSGEGDLAGKRLFLHGEQGLGDSLQFARYVPLLARWRAEITLYVQASLADLLGASLTGVRVAAEGGPPPDFDRHCSLMSLPLAFGTTMATIPPPLRLQLGERRGAFAARIGPKTRPRIGLAWSGNPLHANDRNRSMAFETLAPLLGEDAQWIAIQNQIRASDAEAFAASGRVAFFGDALDDFTATAALIEQMDLVICVDTSLAHLAGSLGKPVWILLPYAPDWRWLLGRADSPWYPSARLFRQPAIGDWASVIANVRTAMRSTAGLSAEKARGPSVGGFAAALALSRRPRETP